MLFSSQERFLCTVKCILFFVDSGFCVVLRSGFILNYSDVIYWNLNDIILANANLSRYLILFNNPKIIAEIPENFEISANFPRFLKNGGLSMRQQLDTRLCLYQNSLLSRANSKTLSSLELV